MSVKHELEMAKEYLTKRLTETEEGLLTHLGTPSKKAGDKYLREKIAYIKKAILMIEFIIPTDITK